MNTKIYQIEKEAIENHVKALFAALEVLEKFDGKVINKKINDAFPVFDLVRISLNKNQYNEKFELETYFSGYIDVGNYVEYARAYRTQTVANITAPGEKRLDYKRAKELIDDEIKRLSLQHIIIDDAQKREKEIREERQRVIDEVKKFNDSLDNVSYNLYYIKNY